MKVMSPIFSSETTSTSTVEFTYISGRSFTELRLLFHKVSFIINTVFPPFCETLHAGRVKPFADASELSRSLWYRASSPKWGPLNAYFRRPKRREVGEY
jgi:hypothetical protein